MAKSWIELGLMTGWPPPADKTVTLANYDQEPFQRWAFINMRELIPSALIPKSPAPAPLVRNLRDLNDFTFTHNGAEYTLADILDTTYVDAMDRLATLAREVVDTCVVDQILRPLARTISLK